MATEIERKFLVDDEKWSTLPKAAGIHYRQGYIIKDQLKTIRIRIAGAVGFITIKGKTTGISRAEYEYAIPLADAEEMLDRFCGEVVKKIRYRVNYAGKIWEVDEFMDHNEGLIVAEIELKTESDAFEIPDWIAQEVTGDERYYNSNLSVNPYKTWQA